MAKNKSKNSVKHVSSGEKKIIRARQEAKRRERFARRKEEGKAYEYKPVDKNLPPELVEAEKQKRRIKLIAGSKLPTAKMTSVMKKADNELEKQKTMFREKSKQKRAN